MGSPQDIFGAAPKTVLNKPYMQVQYKLESGSHGGTSVAGINDRPLNSVIINEIAGASLNSNAVTLPAGTYHIAGMVSAAISNATAVCALRAHVFVNGVSTLLGPADKVRYAADSSQFEVRGQITLTAAGTVELKSWQGIGTSTTGLGAAVSDSYPEVFAELNIWQLDSNIETPVVSDPTMVLAQPLFHARDQHASGGAPQVVSAGWTDCDLNSVVTNEISSADLVSNQVSLAAGTYSVTAFVDLYDATSTSRGQFAVRDSADNILLLGKNGGGDGTFTSHYLEGNITLTETTLVKLSVYSAHNAVGMGRESDSGGVEVYQNLMIRQLDALVQTPVLVNDKLYPLPGNTLVTGNMHGLEYEYSSENSITVQAGICMDSTNQVVLQAASQQVVTIGSVINTIYNLFLCDDGVVRTDTDVDGANLGAYDIRWIGFVTTDPSGEIIEFLQSGDHLTFIKNFGTILSQTITTTYVLLDPSLYVPMSRCSHLYYGGSNGSLNARDPISGQGLIRMDTDINWIGFLNPTQKLKAISVEWKLASGTGGIVEVQAAQMRR